MRTQLISCRLPKAYSALLRSSLFHHLCRFVSLSSGGLASASESLCRGLGSRWFTERFHRNALVTHFQHGQVCCTARHLENYAMPAADFINARPRGDTQLMWLRLRSTSSVPTMLTTRSAAAHWHSARSLRRMPSSPPARLSELPGTDEIDL